MAAVGGVSTVGSVSATAQSGLRAALLRLDVAANNLANLNTDGFVPAHVVGSDLAQGGVRSTIATDQRQREDGAPRESANRSPGDGDPRADGEFPPALLDDPATSSVNPVAEIVNMLLAKAAFVASLRALQTDSVVSRHLMEVLG